jgi:hypothetical protein
MGSQSAGEVSLALGVRSWNSFHGPVVRGGFRESNSESPPPRGVKFGQLFNFVLYREPDSAQGYHVKVRPWNPS